MWLCSITMHLFNEHAQSVRKHRDVDSGTPTYDASGSPTYAGTGQSIYMWMQCSPRPSHSSTTRDTALAKSRLFSTHISRGGVANPFGATNVDVGRTCGRGYSFYFCGGFYGTPTATRRTSPSTLTVRSLFVETPSTARHLVRRLQIGSARPLAAAPISSDAVVRPR